MPGPAEAGTVRAEVSAHFRQILRFHRAERTLHWAIAVPFMVCYATAAILMFGFDLHSQGIARDIFSWLHRISGACLLVLPALVLLRNARDYRIHLQNIRHAWTWTLDDLKWLALFGLAAISRRVKLPDQGKFNAAEKLNFIMVFCSCPLFILTGILIWMPGPVFISWIAHVRLALVATPLMLGHIYMAVVNRSTRAGLGGMFSGYVDREWARHHYRRWYRENFEHEEQAGEQKEEIRRAVSRPALIRCPHCNDEHVVTSWMSLLETVYEFQPFACPNCGADADMVAVIVEPGDGDSILQSLQQAGVRYFSVEKTFEGGIPPAAAYAGVVVKESR
jgi:formate dehydrogenase subunit gamma